MECSTVKKPRVEKLDKKLREAYSSKLNSCVGKFYSRSIKPFLSL